MEKSKWFIVGTVVTFLSCFISLGIFSDGLLFFIPLVTMIFMMFAFPFVMFFWAHIKEVKDAYKNGYGYYDNKTIEEKNVPVFRDIPCNKDIYYAYTLINLNKFNFKNNNILGAIILKWIKEGKISFKKINKSIINVEEYVIDLNMNSVFNYDFEIKLYELLYSASNDGILQPKELSRFVKKNHIYFYNIFEEMVCNVVVRIREKGYIYDNVGGCKFGNVMNEKIYKDSIELYGLKKYLEEFSKMDVKEVKEVKLWDEYLIFACLFGISDKVTKQLKKIYPEILDLNLVGFSYTPLGFEMIDELYDVFINLNIKK